VTFSALASERARTSLFNDRDDPIPHTRLGQRADVVVVAPATARVIGEYAAGIASDLLTATLLATRAPVVVCPAMHTEMWEHAAVQDNLRTLERRGVEVVAPEKGRLAGGDSGEGRLASPGTIVDAVAAVLAGSRIALSKDLAGTRVLVTAGGTREPIDPVRFIANRSSGKQGHAIADAALRRGAEVTLVTTAPLQVAAPIEVVRVETAAEMERAVLDRSDGFDIVVMSAAVADFRPKTQAVRKLRKSDGVPQIDLEPTVDILAELGRRRRRGQVLVGFAAETDDLAERAAAKLMQKGVDVIVANDVLAPGVGFAHDTNAVTILRAGAAPSAVALASKHDVAMAVLDAAAACRAGAVAADPQRDAAKTLGSDPRHGRHKGAKP
jgi:phosphopantothenoylcysteine decarboxylase/phosphopantothenate--cysteine ligase